MCPNRDVLCGFLLCVNISGAPRLGDLGGDISSVTFYHQGKELDCRCCLGTMAGGGRDEVTTVMGTRGQGLRLVIPPLQGRPRAASRWLRPELCGGRHSLWAQHAVPGSPLSASLRLQLQHLPRKRRASDLLPSWGGCLEARESMLEEACTGTWPCLPMLPSPTCRFAATKGSVSVSQTGQAKTAVFTTHCPRPLPPGRLRDTKVRLKLASTVCIARFPCLSLPTKPCPPPQVPAVPTSSLAPSPGLSWSQPSSWAARAGDLSKRHMLPRSPPGA